VVGSIAFEDAARAVSDVRSALLFLVFAVPLAVTLDQIGVFGALAAMVDGGRHLVAGLWWLAAAVVVVFNLDAAVVLLTPLYIRIARRHGFDVEALAFQPALLACLASSVLPVSNLTNLIVAEQQHLGFYDFVTQLAPASLAATTVGFIAYRRVFHLHPTTDRVDDPVDPRALRRGLPIIAFVLAGFTVGDLAGISAWIVTAVALMWAAAWTRHVPWRAVPVAAIATTAGLVVVVAAAVPHLALDRWFDSPGTAGALRATGAATALSNLTNNLPVSLAASSSIEHPERSWPLLVGTNIGSIFVVTASLSTLLWRDTATRSGVFVSAGRWTAVAVRVGIPALVAATAVVAFVGR
jgi:arsenical pump membrane protein